MHGRDCPNSAEDKAAYEEEWRILLSNLLGWPDGKAADWARLRIQSVGDNPYLTHEHASWYLLSLLVPDDLKAKLGPRLNQFGSSLERAIHSSDRMGLRITEPGYDWDDARRRLARLIKLAADGVDPSDM